MTDSDQHRSPYDTPDGPWGDSPARLCYVDTETTSLVEPWLPHGRRPWEVTLRRVGGVGHPREDGDDAEVTLVVTDVDLTHADPQSLTLARFHGRHSDGNDGHVITGLRPDTPPYEYDDRFLALVGGRLAAPERAVAEAVERLTRGVVLAGCNVGFDAATLAAMLHRNGLPASWHYSPYDVKSAAAAALGGAVPPDRSTNALARALGIDPDQYDRHSSAGDVALAVAMDAAARARVVDGRRV